MNTTYNPAAASSSPSRFLSFSLDDEFVASYVSRRVPWGFPIGAGNSLGELTFLTKYSRRKPDATKERWFEVCRRVVEGYYSILKDHCAVQQTPWNPSKAQRAAQDAYERMFVFKWLPPGRGLWMMGTDFVHGDSNSAALQNCAFVSTGRIGESAVHAVRPFVRLMEMSMLGIGVGFDTKGAGKLVLHEPDRSEMRRFTVPDSREGWCASVDLLLSSFFVGGPVWVFDYSMIRPAGQPIKAFGGTAAGPEPLCGLHRMLNQLLSGRAGESLTSTDIVDVQNLIGKCVVAGNVRRSAEIALGDFDDAAFRALKNVDRNPRRMGVVVDDSGAPLRDGAGTPVFSKDGGWAFASNNSLFADIGCDYSDVAASVAANGEPGLFWLELVRNYGRLADPRDGRDYRAAGTNPCAEQSLESFECCTLVESFPTNHDSFDDFAATLKHAYLYAKAVTLLNTHWPETNEVMNRNHRIGCSVSGSAQFAETRGWSVLRRWLDDGYQVITARDRNYSEWLGVRESIRMTSVKPSGTVSLLAGVTPGVHWPTASTYIRRMRLSVLDPLVPALTQAGYLMEADLMDPETTLVVELPTNGPAVRTEQNVSVWEKAALAALHQRWWADNQVSVSLTFLPHETDQILPLLQAYEGQLKSVSFLPLLPSGAYRQMPYEAIDAARFTALTSDVSPLDWDGLYNGADTADAQGESFCTTDRCEIPLTID